MKPLGAYDVLYQVKLLIIAPAVLYGHRFMVSLLHLQCSS